MFRILFFLVVAMVIGSLGARLAGSRPMGCALNIFLGFIGALLGGWMSEKTGVRDILYYKDVPIAWSVAGAALFVALLSMLAGRSMRR